MLASNAIGVNFHQLPSSSSPEVKQNLNPKRGLFQANNIMFSNAKSFIRVIGSTSLDDNDIEINKIRNRIDFSLRLLNYEYYDDFDKYTFTHQLGEIIADNTDVALDILNNLIKNEIVIGINITHILKAIGEFYHPDSHFERFYFLSRFLFSDSTRERDAATLGLSLLNDDLAIFYLQKAMQVESDPILRKNYQKVIDQFEK
ncbi:MAG: hypothetical protein JEZ00_21450 [Anaerolineaceae bacterium]|nr:hypothetical protein [Anaerolineaceae bacterium]